MVLTGRRILRELRDAGFAATEVRAVRDTPAMWLQLVRFYRGGGRVQRVDAAFSAATGQPGRVCIFCPPSPAVCAHATYGVLAHELGHALRYPDQWRPLDSFDDVEAYAHVREMGEAHAWLNQYRLCRARASGASEDGQWQRIENDHDFGTPPVDLFARIAQRETQGWPEARILHELAVLNANMFPCGMGEGNHKTYGQCNRWDWLHAHRDRVPLLRAFLHRLGRAPTAADQKLLIKFNLLTLPHADAAVLHLADALAPLAQPGELPALFALAQGVVPHAQPGVAAAARGDANSRLT